MQRYQRHYIEQQNANLVNGNPPVVEGIEEICRELEPPTMHAKKPVVRGDKYAKPHEQDAVVDYRAPEQEVFQFTRIHGATSPRMSVFRVELRLIEFNSPKFTYHRSNRRVWL